jgi:ribosome-associated protein
MAPGIKSGEPNGLDIDLHDPLHLARSCAALLDEKKITDLQIYDVADSVAITSFFVIGTGLNPRHLQSVVDHLQHSLKDHGVKRRGVEGYREGKWILFDLGDVIVHLFLSETRTFYDLDLLWGDAPRMDLCLPERRQVVT